MKRIAVSMYSAGILTLCTGMAFGQDYPNKPIRIVAGGTTSTASVTLRIIAPEISGPLGQPVIMDNRGSGAILGEIVGKAPPDGYTLLASGSGFWVETLTRSMPYDAVKDFSPISLMARSPIVLYVHPSLPVKSVKELIALAKAKPGELNISIGGLGGITHLTAELFKAMAGVNIVTVPYSSDSQELADLVGGRVQLTFTASATMMQQVKLGKLRALAIGSVEPSTLFPDLPMVAATVPGYESVGITGIWAPAKTPATIINRLSQEIVRFLKTAEAKERLLSIGIEAVGSSPEQLAAVVKSEMAKLGKVIKDAGIGAK